MKKIKLNANMKPLLQPLSEIAQQTVRGGASDCLLEFKGIQSRHIGNLKYNDFEVT